MERDQLHESNWAHGPTSDNVTSDKSESLDLPNVNEMLEMELSELVPRPSLQDAHSHFPAMAEVENHFTVFVRLPFNRGSFVDPPPVRGCCLLSLLLHVDKSALGSMVVHQGASTLGDSITSVEK